MATYNTLSQDAVALSVTALGAGRSREPHPNKGQRLCCGHGFIALNVVGTSMIFLGIVTIIFGILCASAGVQYGITGDTHIKPWRSIPLGILAVASGASGIHSTRYKPRRFALAAMLVSAVTAAWATAVIFAYSFDVAEKSKAYATAKDEYVSASISRNEFAGYRKNVMDRALRDVVYFTGAISFAIMTAITCLVHAVLCGLYVSDPNTGVDLNIRRRTSGPMSRNVLSSMTRVFVNYKPKAALATGIIQIVCGSSVVLGLGLALATEHDPAWASYVISHGVVFISAGIVGALSSNSKSRMYVTASMVMSLVAAVGAVNMISSDVEFIINAHVYPTTGRSKIDKNSLTVKLFAIHGLDLFVNLIQLMAAMTLSGLGCHVTCDVAAKADATRCHVSYVQIGRMDKRTDPVVEQTDREGPSIHLPDILQENRLTEDDLFGSEPPQYFADAMVRNP